MAWTPATPLHHKCRLSCAVCCILSVCVSQAPAYIYARHLSLENRLLPFAAEAQWFNLPTRPMVTHQKGRVTMTIVGLLWGLYQLDAPDAAATSGGCLSRCSCFSRQLLQMLDVEITLKAVKWRQRQKFLVLGKLLSLNCFKIYN